MIHFMEYNKLYPNLQALTDIYIHRVQGPVQQPHRRLQERELRPEDYSEHLLLEDEERG